MRVTLVESSDIGIIGVGEGTFPSIRGTLAAIGIPEARFIRVNLELEGIEVHVACDGQEALEVVHDVDPDLITMDVMMPRLDGLAAATRLKSRPETAAIPIVMVTARAQTADRVAGKQRG